MLGLCGVCVCVCVCLSVCLLTHICVGVVARGQYQGILLYLSLSFYHSFFETGSLMEPGSHQLSETIQLVNSSTHLFSLLSTGITGLYHHSWLFSPIGAIGPNSGPHA